MRTVSTLALALSLAPAAHAQWRTSPGGPVPVRESVQMPVHHFAYDGGSAIYVNADGNVVYATDDGARAVRMPFFGTNGGYIKGLGLDGANAYAFYNQALYRSTDAGVTWTALPFPGLASRVKDFVGATGGAVYASSALVTTGGTSGTLYRSTDGGATWSALATLPMRFTYVQRVGATLYLNGKPTAGGNAWLRSTDDGATWTDITPASYFVTPGGTTRTQEMRTWVDQTNGALYVTAALYRDGGQSVEWLVLRSTDQGATWTRLNAPLQNVGDPPMPGNANMVITSMAALGQTLVLGYGHGAPFAIDGLWLSTDGGTSWRRPVRSANGRHYDSAKDMGYDPKDRANHPFVAAAGRFLWSSDGVALPTAIDGPGTEDGRSLGSADTIRATLAGVRVRLKPLAPSTIADSVFVRLNPDGNAPRTFTVNTALQDVTYPVASPHTWSITLDNVGNTTYLTGVVEFPFDPARVPNPAALVLLKRSVQYERTLWRPVDAADVSLGPGVVRFNSRYFFSSDRLPGDYALASADPANDLSLPATGVGTDGVAEASAFALDAPVPSPARGAASVRFVLARPGKARLNVFDLLGREVAVLHDGPAVAGATVARIDASALAPGVYVVRLVANGSRRTQRLVVAR